MNYLDKTGLAHLWAKIKGAFASKEVVDGLQVNDDSLYEITSSLEASDAETTQKIEELEEKIRNLENIIEQIQPGASNGWITERVEGGWITYGTDED